MQNLDRLNLITSTQCFKLFKPGLALLGGLILSACASNPGTPPQADKQSATDADAQKTSQVVQDNAANQGDQVTNPDTATPEPETDLSPELLFRLLVAEISGSRGHINVAAKQYLEAARVSRDPKVIERATRIAVYARDTKAALEAANMWVEVEPNSIEANQVAAAMNVRLGKIAEAQVNLENVINLGEKITKDKKTNIFMLIQSLLSKEQDKAAVLTLMGKLVANRQDNPDALYAYSQLAQLVGDLEVAKEAVLKVIQLRPKWSDAQILYSTILYRQGKKAQALTELKLAVDKEPDNVALRDYYARRLVDEKRYREAREQFRIVTEQKPDNPDSMYALALVTLQLNNFEEAEALFKRLVKEGKRVNESSYYLGQISEQLDKLEAAVQWYKVVSTGRYQFDAQIRIALIEGKQGKIKQARERLHNVDVDTEVQDMEQRLLLAEGEVLRQAKMHQEAFDLYSEGLATLHNNVSLLYARALTAEKIERIDVTFADLKKIIEIEPTNAQALNALGYTMVDRTDKIKEGKAYIEMAYKINPNDPATLDSLGWANYRLGNYKEAVKFLRMAFEKLKDSEIAAHLGEVLWVMGEQDSAKDIWDEALRSTPTHKLLNDVVNRFTK